MKTFLLPVTIAAFVASLGVTTSALAVTNPTGTLRFETPEGTVNQNDSIPVNLVLTLDNTSASLDTAFLESLIPSSWASTTTISYNVSYTCSDTFSACNDPDLPYAFNFYWGSGTGVEVVQQLTSLTAGNSLNFTIGTLIPNGGSAPVGTYNLYTFSVFAQLYGLDSDGVTEVHTDVDLFTTCDDSSGAGCSGNQLFTRTVSAVPEPETYALLLAGLGLIGFMVRLRKF